MKRRRLLAALLAMAAGAALGDEPDQVFVSYEVGAGQGRISGVSRSMEWSATQLAGGGVRIELRVPAASFDSGHPKFDALVREALQAAQHPFIEAEGVVRNGRFEGTLMLRGVAQKLSVPVHVVRSGQQLVIDTAFPLDLAQYGIALAPQASIEFVARVSASPAAVASGGALSSN